MSGQTPNLWFWDYITLAEGEILVALTAGARLIKRPVPDQPVNFGKLAELFGGIIWWGKTVSFVVEKLLEVARVAADMYGYACKPFEEVWNHFMYLGGGRDWFQNVDFDVFVQYPSSHG